MKRRLMNGTVVIGLLATSAALAAEGTGVGNGGNSARDQYLLKLKNEMSLSMSRGKNPAHDVIDWCSRVSAALMRERQRAMLQYQYNRRAQAEQILIDALVVAGQSLETNPDQSGPMTKMLIDRTLTYSQALDQALGSGAPFALSTKLNFLFGSVDFIVQIAREFDPPYYIPYRYQYNRCHECPPDFDFSAFERQFVAMAARQLSFVTEHLTEAALSGHGVNFVPVGDPRAFLTVAELSTSFVAHDLRDNLHAYANACSIRDLESLSQTLTSYNLYGDRSIFPNDRWAVDQVREEMDRIADQIHQNSRCRY